MSIISGYRKLKNYILETEGYKLISRWTSAHTVEFDNGQTAVEKINEMELDIAGRIPASQKGIASGVATLGQDGKIPVDQIPKVALDTLITVPDNEARFALTIQDCQKGDTVKVLNDGAGHEKMYLVIDDTKLDGEEGYEGYAATAAWGTIREKPTNLICYGQPDSSTEVPTSADFITRGQIIDHLSSTDATLPLSARQGNILKSSLDEMQTEADGIQEEVNGIQGEVDGIQKTVGELNTGLAKKQDKLTNPLTESDVVDNLTSTTTKKPLSAAQGKILNDKISQKSRVFVQLATITGNGSDWAIVSNAGKYLITAQTVREDTSFYVKGINKQNATGVYTLIFSENIEKSAKQAVWLTWID